MAEREGLHGAVAFPVVLRGDVVSVMEFFSQDIRRPDEELLATRWSSNLADILLWSTRTWKRGRPSATVVRHTIVRVERLGFLTSWPLASGW